MTICCRLDLKLYVAVPQINELRIYTHDGTHNMNIKIYKDYFNNFLSFFTCSE